MPLYDYRCPNCKNMVEILHKIEEEPTRIEALCRKGCDALMQRIPPVGVSAHFKGSGFYSTDYKGK